MSRIIVKNLPSTISEKKLRDVFEKMGCITDLQLKYNKAGVFRKFAFVGFKTEDEAKAAQEYFNNTFIFTSKVQVEMCSNLNDPNRPKAWKEFLKEKAEKSKLDSPTKENQKKSKSSKSEDDAIPEELKKDPKFKEFLSVHEDRKSKPSWADDIGNFEEEDNPLSSGDDDCNTSQKAETEQEKSPASEKKPKNKRKKTKNVSEKKDTTEQEVSNKEVKIYGDLYTVKLRNLSYNCKKKHIKELFRPLKITSLRIPPVTKGFAYVSFETEKDMNIALNKHRGFLCGRRIDVIKYTRKENFESQKQSQQVEGGGEVDMELLAESGRIYVRNLYFSITESELQDLFSKFGPLHEIHLPIDKLTKKAQGFAFVSYQYVEHAMKAFAELDGTIFQGRVLHLIPAKPKKEFEIDENETNFKKKKEAKMRSLAESSHNWNILYLSSNAVRKVIAKRYDIDESKFVSGDTKESLPVRLVHAETQLVMETRKFLIANGVQLDALSQPAAERSKTVIIVKNLQANTSSDELKEVFGKYGTILRIVLPPTGIIALIEFQHPTEAKIAFKSLVYRQFHRLPLYLEWAPVDFLKEPPPKVDENDEPSVKENESAPQDESLAEESEPPPGTTVFVKNVNFCTTNENFKKHFEQCGPTYSAVISAKKDFKTGKLLSMGFGFVRYKTKTAALKAIQVLQLSKLDGYSLEIKFANQATIPSASIKRKKYEITKQETAKILVKNLPFSATESEVRELFREFGVLKSVRLPKKMGTKNKHRGFCFVEYTTKSDAQRAFNTLCHSSHFYGRRLVLEWANPESQDVEEIRKKTARDFVNSEPKTKLKKSKLKDDVALASALSRPEE